MGLGICFFLSLFGGRNEAQQNKFVVIVACFLAGEMAFELIWSIWETQRVRLI